MVRSIKNTYYTGAYHAQHRSSMYHRDNYRSCCRNLETNACDFIVFKRRSTYKYEWKIFETGKIFLKFILCNTMSDPVSFYLSICRRFFKNLK